MLQPTSQQYTSHGMPLILLRNMNGAEGQAYGTCLIFRGIMSDILDAETALGSHIGERGFLPRIRHDF